MSPIRFALACCLAVSASSAFAQDGKPMKVVELYQQKDAMAGQLVRVDGKVVKVNNGIMGRNFVHVRDGTGDEGSNNLIVTSKQTAAVGDAVVVTGRVTLNRDFGAGYMYPLLLEESSIAGAK